MAFCPSCGVEVTDEVKKCPLCGINIPDSAGGDLSSTYPDHIFNAENVERISTREVRKIILEILSVSCVISIAITMLLDVFLTKGLTWSRYTTLCVASGWLLLAMPLIFYNRPWTLYAVLAPSAVGIVFALNLLEGKLTWFLPLGLPITLLVDGMWAAVMGTCSGFREKGLNVLASIFLGVAILLVGIELTINRFASVPYWSVIAAFALVPIAFFCLYLHYRITKRASLRKLFRL